MRAPAPVASSGPVDCWKQLLTLAEQRYVSPSLIAQVHAGFGDADLAVEWLERAIEVRAADLAWLAVRPSSMHCDRIRGSTLWLRGFWVNEPVEHNGCPRMRCCRCRFVKLAEFAVAVERQRQCVRDQDGPHLELENRRRDLGRAGCAQADRPLTVSSRPVAAPSA